MPALAAIGEGLVELEQGSDPQSLRMAAGGDAANIAVMASLLGAESRLAGRVGKDPMGEWLLSFWSTRGVDVADVRTDPHAATGLYLNVADSVDHRFVYWRQGSAGSRVTASEISDAFFADVAVVVMTGVTHAVSDTSAHAAEYVAQRARANGARVACVLNHRPALSGDVARLGAVARNADIVIGSVEDAALVFGDDDVGRLHRGPLPVAELVITAGDGPAKAIVDDAAFAQPVPRVDVANAAGAGDAFAGAYLARRVASDEPVSALRWAVAAAALSVGRRGCASSYPTFSETSGFVDALLAAA